MKTFNLFLSILLIPVCVLAQDTVTTNPSPVNFMDTARVEFITEQTTSFRFIHPQYNDAFWSQQKLAQKIIELYSLTPSSTEFEIVYAAADFHKTRGLHVNNEILQATNIEQPNALSVVDHYSMQCGHFADKVKNVTDAITSELSVPAIQMRRVSLAAHQVLEYYDNALSKWVFMDPDPGNPVFIPMDNGNLVSFSEIQSNPSILLDTTTTVFHTLLSSDAFSRNFYYNFMSPMLSTVTYNSITTIQDSRDMIYTVPASSSIKFELINNKIYLNTDAAYAQDSMILQNLFMAFYLNDMDLVYHYFNQISQICGYDTSYAMTCYPNWNMFINNGSPTDLKHKDSEDFFTVTIPAGFFDSTEISIPNLIKSIRPANAGYAYQVNGVTYTDTTNFNLYTNPATPNIGVDPSQINYGIRSLNVPSEVESLTISFYFNPELFQFWEQQWNILIEQGELIHTDAIDTAGNNNLSINSPEEIDIDVYPNPTTDFVKFTDTVERLLIYSSTGQLIETINNPLIVDISTYRNGIYYFDIFNNNSHKSVKVIKQ